MSLTIFCQSLRYKILPLFCSLGHEKILFKRYITDITSTVPYPLKIAPHLLSGLRQQVSATLKVSTIGTPQVKYHNDVNVTDLHNNKQQY